LYETIIKEGFKLTSKIEQLDNNKKNLIYNVTNPDGSRFLICLDAKLDRDTLKKLDLQKDQTFICRDSALDDSMAANLALQCRLKTL
jgi:adenine-specific DNA-methyltransferase